MVLFKMFLLIILWKNKGLWKKKNANIIIKTLDKNVKCVCVCVYIDKVNFAQIENTI